MSSGKVKCTCGWSWNKSDSSKKDMYICHECGRDNSNNMKNGGWLDSYADGGTMQEHQENYNDNSVSLPEGYVGEGYDTTGRNYSPAWGGQFEEGGEIPMAQNGNKKPLYVKSKNDPRYKAYQDSLSLYKSTPIRVAELKKINKKIVDDLAKKTNKVLKSEMVKVGNEPFNKNRNRGYYQEDNKMILGHDSSIKPISFDKYQMKKLDGSGVFKYFDGNNIQTDDFGVYKKPQQPVIVKPKSKPKPKQQQVVQPDLPRVEAISLPPMQQLASIAPPTTSEVVRSPKSYNVNMKTYNMKGGPIDYYTRDAEGVDYEQAMRMKSMSDAFNRDIEKRYGPQNKYRTPKSAAEAAERLKQLRSEFEITPNYQMGGSVYPVNYVPQAQNGKLTFLQPTSDKLPEGYRIPYADPSSELAMSIGGENGEPAYLIPSFKYGKPLYDPIGEFKKTGEHLGGPFKTWQEADEWERTVRHPAVERKENIMFPQEQFAMGGSIPGAVGFSYARTNDPAPSNGPYAKKTKASAQNGAWLDNYDVAQNGEKIENDSANEEPQFAPILIEEVVIKKPLTNFAKIRGQIKKQNTWEDYAQKYLGNFEKNMGQTINNLPEYRKQEYEDYVNKLAFDEYVKKYPKAKGEDRGAYIDRIQAENADSSNFERAYEANAPYNDETDINKWRKSLMGLGSLVLPKLAMDKLKQNSDYFSKKEKQAMIDNPISTYVNDVMGTIEPLSIPVESIYGNKSFGDIASGQSADIPMSMRVIGDPLMVLGEAAPLLGKGISAGAKALGTEEGLLSNAWKLNPKAYQYNLPENTMWRGLGQEGMEDAVSSGLFRSKQNVVPEYYPGTSLRMDKSFGTNPYFTPKFKTAATYGDQYLGEVPRDVANWRQRYKRSDWSQVSDKPIPIDEGRILQKDWLQGYKPIEVPKQNFKSEIDWSKWNSEIPENKALMNEYNAIEETSKANGTWMKNPDGSPFQGTPEQFVQQNSENFKKAFSNTKVRDPKGNIQITNHSTWDKFDEFDLNKFGQTDDGFYGKGVYFHPNTNSQGLYGDINMNSYVNIENPMPHENHFFFGREGKGSYWDSAKDEQVKIDDLSSLWKNKYDGYITNHANYPLNDFNSTEYITNIPSNIKSATGNNGMFDMTNPNIYKAMLPIGLGLGAASQLDQKREGGVIKDDMGYWNPDNWGKDVEIDQSDPNSFIDMEGVYEPLLGVSDKGERRIMYPGEKHKFKKGTKKVTESRIAKNGLRQEQKGLVNLDQLTNFTNYNTKQPGGWLDKY